MSGLNRRAFLSALAASVMATGGVLPVGFPQEPVAADQWNYYALVDRHGKIIVDRHGKIISRAPARYGTWTQVSHHQWYRLWKEIPLRHAGQIAARYGA